MDNINGYDLSRNWFNWSFDNPDKVKPIHSAIYFFAIEHCNRLGWKDKFGFPSQMVMESIGVKNWRTYSKALNDLVDFGFIKMIEISKNQYSSNIIAIVKNTKAPTKALDKALSKHSTKHSQSTVSIDKQLNKEQLNNINSPSIEERINGFLNWFNESLKKEIGRKGKFKGLDKTGVNNYKKLLKAGYSKEDFKDSFKQMTLSKWAVENNMLTPSHFLRNENFAKYLNTNASTDKKPNMI